MCERWTAGRSATGEKRCASCHVARDTKPRGKLQTTRLLIHARGQLSEHADETYSLSYVHKRLKRGLHNVRNAMDVTQLT